MNMHSIKYILCSSGKCLKIPEIQYSYNPLKTEFSLKCNCDIDNNKIKINLEEYLDKYTYINCISCMKKILDDKFYYCMNCKILLDYSCAVKHHNLSHFITSSEIIFNFCLAHNNKFMFRCVECNQSLCANCDLNFHNEHTLEQISRLPLNQNGIDKIKSSFEKQKKLFEKIKEINNRIIQNLENDIIIKERIINNYSLNKFNYNSNLNLNSLYINNNEKYEKILEEILAKMEENNNSENKEINCSDYINGYLSSFYYSLMINKDEKINESLIDELEKKFSNVNNSKHFYDNRIINIENQINEEKIINNSNIDMNKNNSSFSNNSNKLLNSYTNPNTENNYFSNINTYSETKNLNLINSPTFSQSYIKENIPINKSISYIKKSSNIKNKDKKLSNSDKNIKKKSSKKIKSSSEKKKKKENKNKEENKTESESEEISDSIVEEKNEEIKINSIRNTINNMIILKSGNIAVSMKEAIEIYDLRKLNFSGANYVYNNELIKNNCLIQKINIVKGRYINYVFELFDETLLCASSSRIFRIKLINHDLNYEVIGFIKIDNESPTKIISLGKSFLVILTEQKKYCNIRLYEKKEEIMIVCKNEKEKGNNKKEELNCDDVPPIGNCGLFLNKDISEDTSFELIKKNINENKKLFVTIHPIEKDDNNKEDNYLYEFIATSNHVFDYTTSRLVFYGLFRNNKNEYCVNKIKEINGLSCSIGADSICQINNKYLCVGLQRHDLNGQMDGFAFIDIFKREINRIIYDNEISSICYNSRNNLLFASMEINEFKKKAIFLTKIYKIIENKGDKGNEEIDLKVIYQYHSKNTYDTITSIQQMTLDHFEKDSEDKDEQKDIIFVTSSKNSSLEVVKADI